MPISAGMTSFVSDVRENGVSPLLDLIIVRWDHMTCESSPIQSLLLSYNLAFIPSSKLLFALSTKPFVCWCFTEAKHSVFLRGVWVRKQGNGTDRYNPPQEPIDVPDPYPCQDPSQVGHAWDVILEADLEARGVTVTRSPSWICPAKSLSGEFCISEGRAALNFFLRVDIGSNY
ncbi:hypothetical protein Tco_1000608 [Tanacetum coccineum]